MGIVVDTGVFILCERRGHSVDSRLFQLDRPGYHDLWIAATAINYGYAIMTTNSREFSRIQNLEVIPIDTT